jgi:hypothetical protein
MHPIRHPRNAALVGVGFIILAIILWGVPTYGGWHVDYAGTTILVFLGVAVSLMAYVLVAGSGKE